MRVGQLLSRWLCINLSLLLVSLPLYSVDAQTVTPVPDSPPLKLIWQSELSPPIKNTPDVVFTDCGDMAVDADGNLYVSDALGDAIKKFDGDGKLVAQWGTTGKDEGQFDLPQGIAVDTDGNVYVADFGNMRIQKFDSEGNFLQAWANLSNFPGHVGVDPQGNLYVVYKFPDDLHVQKFDSSGNSVSEWSSTAAGGGKFGTRLEDLALDADGNLYIADPNSYVIQRLDPDGSFLTPLIGQSKERFAGQGVYNGGGFVEDPYGVTVDSQGNIYVLDSYFLQKLDAEGHFIAQWANDGSLFRVRTFAVDEKGYLYACAYVDTGGQFRRMLVEKFRQPAS